MDPRTSRPLGSGQTAENHVPSSPEIRDPRLKARKALQLTSSTQSPTPPANNAVRVPAFQASIPPPGFAARPSWEPPPITSPESMKPPGFATRPNWNPPIISSADNRKPPVVAANWNHPLIISPDGKKPPMQEISPTAEWYKPSPKPLPSPSRPPAPYYQMNNFCAPSPSMNMPPFRTPMMAPPPGIQGFQRPPPMAMPPGNCPPFNNAPQGQRPYFPLNAGPYQWKENSNTPRFQTPPPSFPQRNLVPPKYPPPSIQNNKLVESTKPPERRTDDRRVSRDRKSRSPDRDRPRRSNSRDRDRDRRSSRSHSYRRSRSRDRNRSRSRESSRRRSQERRRSRSRERSTRARSPDRSRRQFSRESSRRSRSSERGRRPSSRNSSRRSRSSDRGRRPNSRDRSRRPNSRESSRRPNSRDRSRRPSSRDRSRSSQRSRNGSPGKRCDEEMSRREALIEKWRRLNCKDDAELEERLLAISKMEPDQLLMEQQNYWIRSAPATTYYERNPENAKLMKGTAKLEELCSTFSSRLIENARQVRASQTLTLPPAPRRKLHKCMHHHHANDSCSSDSDEEEEVGSEESRIMEELQRKIKHPYRLHEELWYNEPGEMNDGPLCKCSVRARRSGIRHGIYAGEDKIDVEGEKEAGSAGDQKVCDSNTNNAGKLYHYRITISPPTNFLSKTPTIINHDGHEFIFAGFSLFSHYPLPKLPVCKVIRFNIEYIILYAEESFPENFTIRECDLLFDFLFREILELVDLDLYSTPGRCPVFHFMPRFVRELVPEGHELLPMCVVMKYLLTSFKPLVPKEILPDIPSTSTSQWQGFAEAVKGMIVTKPGIKPSSIRVDQLDKDVHPEGDEKKKESCDDKNKEICGEKKKELSEGETSEVPYPEIIHFGIRPPQLSYAGNQDYQKAWREYIKQRHLIANLAKPTPDDKQKLVAKEAELHRMRNKSNMKRDVTATVSSEGFYRTGLMCDVVQHAMLIPVLACHLRFHRSLDVLEKRIGYVFKNRSLLQLALTHPSYRENFGTNPDHARNSLTNCGIRQPEYGDRRIHYMSTKKRGINTLMTIMSRFGSKKEQESNIYHNERLEFLGDAVVEFVSTIHLFHMFRDLEEGGLATYRAALVQNQHLAVLAKVLNLDAYLLYAHGSDLCHDLELNHALANCFEAVMGALFLDGDVDVADRVFGKTVFGHNEDLLDVWENYPPHPLQDQEPEGDRKWIDTVDFLKNLTKFEDAIGVEFTHIRLLARSFTDRSVGYTNLTLGSNQRLEFLGDSVLQLVASDYLYKHFPDHHEGHLSLLRSSLVNNNTQSVVCDDLGMTVYARYAATKGDLKVKDKADLIEAFLGALYIDKGDLVWVEQFCKVCFFPRLRDFIRNQEWNDPKSKLQQCCLTLRTMDGGEPDIPCYKVVECKGPTNTRTYSVAVYFRGKRLATAAGHSIQQAEMNAAQAAMQTCEELFPQLAHQTRAIRKHITSKPDRTDSKPEPPAEEVTKKKRCATPERYKIRRRRRSSSSSASDGSRRSISPAKARKSSSSSKSPSPVRRPRIRKSSSSSPPSPLESGKFDDEQGVPNNEEFLRAGSENVQLEEASSTNISALDTNSVNVSVSSSVNVQVPVNSQAHEAISGNVTISEVVSGNVLIAETSSVNLQVESVSKTECRGVSTQTSQSVSFVPPLPVETTTVNASPPPEPDSTVD